MNSFELNIIDEKSFAGSAFMDRVAKELRRALMSEKASRKITQQSLADKIGTSRSVINREVQGLENLTSRRIGELFWALGWEPHFEARKIPAEEGQQVPNQPTSVISTSIKVTPSTTGGIVDISRTVMPMRAA